MATKNQKPKKLYTGDHRSYRKKLEKIMQRLGVPDHDLDYEYTHNGGWVKFKYKGVLYFLEHTIEKAAEHGIRLHYASDAWAQLIYTIEDLVRANERGVYPLQAFISEFKQLEAPKEIPACFKLLGFDRIPGKDEVKTAFRELAKALHPDVTKKGTSTAFQALKKAEEDALAYLEEGEGE